MNRIYNFQDTLILCEIVEQRASACKNFLNLFLESAIVQVLFLLLSTETKANVTLSCLQTPKKLEFLKRL